MNATKFLLALWISTALYCVLQLSFGPGGATEYASLKQDQERLQSRVDALQTENARLTAWYQALRTSPESVRLEARRLGYFQPGELPVRTQGPVGFRLPSPTLDSIALPPPSAPNPNLSVFFRLIWPMLFLISWTVLWGIDRLRRGPAAQALVLRQVVESVPVQTALDFFRK